MNFLRKNGIYLAWLICLIGSFMSLYFSELRHLEPCRFCWMQRVALFPLAIQLGIFAYRFDGSAFIYGIPLCFIGFAAAFLQSLDLIIDIRGLCGPGASCREGMIYFFDAVPFSWVSGIGFVFVAILLWMGRHPKVP